MAVIGTGLIGTSVALAARKRGVSLFLADRDAAVARAAAALGAGVAEPPGFPVDLAVVAVPPGQVGAVLADAQSRGLAQSYTDVASVKGEPERVVLGTAPDPASYVGGHPMAGRERSGPTAARADLFHGRSWALTPSAVTTRAALDRGLELARLCGAAPVVMSSREHDEIVALTSHAPHLVASLLAAKLAEAPGEVLRLAGPGLRDATRIAAGDPALWSDIVRANAPAVARVMRGLRADLCRLEAALDELAGAADRTCAASAAAIGELLDRGVAGVARLPQPPPADAAVPETRSTPAWASAPSSLVAGGHPAPADGGRSISTPAGARQIRISLRAGPGALWRLLRVIAGTGVLVLDVAVEPAAEDRMTVLFAVPDGQNDDLLAELRAG